MLSFIRNIIKGIIAVRKTTQELTGLRDVPVHTYDMIKKYEGYESKAYQDAKGVWTIGYGNTYYEDGTPVRQGDIITRSRAEILFKTVVDEFAQEVNDAVRTTINDCQFSALISFTYNVGTKQFKSSTLLKKVNRNPNDPAITTEFNKWIKSGGKTIKGLIIRRKLEAEYYFTNPCK